jgi:uncharacterized protein (DUF58 family)
MKIDFFKSFFFTPLFFTTGIAAVFLCGFGFAFPIIFRLGQAIIALLIALVLADFWLLYFSGMRFSGTRNTPRALGLGDETEIKLAIQYEGRVDLDTTVIDEIPEQVQRRDLQIAIILRPGVTKATYKIKPLSRGLYRFGKVNLLVESPIHFVKRRISLPLESEISVLPSVAQMRAVEMLAFSRVSNQQGSKRFRRIGMSYEFEQITPFVEGDDYRNINWKATGKTRELMSNQYQDERSQNMYCILSKGRAMRLAFNGMSMLDYAINASLALSNVALKKYDKVGLITYSNKIGTAIRADNRHGQLQKISEALYNEQERDLEPSYELLYRSIDRVVKSRSLLMLFANFETSHMLERALPILKKISRKHLLVMILFKDDDLEILTHGVREDTDSIYRQTLASKHLSEKEEIAIRLRHQGIQTIVSSPKQLSVDTINKYMELKSRGMI